MIILFTLDGKAALLRILLICRLAMMCICDLIFIPQYHDLGAAYSDIAGNTLIAILSVFIAWHYGLIRFGKADGKLWLKEWGRIGIFAGIQIFLDNFIYAIIVVRMVNAVSASGIYWAANNFIYGWLLVPVSALAEIIKRNKYEKLTTSNAWRPMLWIVLFWLLSAPFWRPFMKYGMALEDYEQAMQIIFPMMAFYLAYVPCQIIDGWFVSRGKTQYLMLISIAVNIVYYGIVYRLFLQGVFSAGLPFIIGMFGCGMIVHMALSMLCYKREQHLLSKEKGGTK